MDTSLVGGSRGLTPAAERGTGMRVLHVSSGNLYGGVERIITALAELRALCPSMSPLFALAFDGRQADELRAAGASPRLLGAVRLSRPGSVIRARRALGRLLDEEQPDVVVCHNPWPLAVFGPSVKRRRVPLAAWVHGALSGTNWLERLARRVRPNLVIANSHFSGHTAELVFPGVPREVVYAPLVFSRPAHGARDRVRRTLGVADESVVILQVSRIELGKGHMAHVRALIALRDDPSWTAWFAGGAQRPPEQALMTELQGLVAGAGLSDRIRFLGERADIDDLLVAADVFCQPNTLPDAFGLSFVEALAMGVPVVTTGMGGAIEVVDESCGVLVPAGNQGALVDALGRLVRDASYRQALGRAGPARAHRLCDPESRLADLRSALGRLSKVPLPGQTRTPW